MCNVLSSHFLLGATEALGSSERQCGLDSAPPSYSTGVARDTGIYPSAPARGWLMDAPFPSLVLLVCHTQEQTPGIRESPQMEEACRDWRLVKLTGKGPGQ